MPPMPDLTRILVVAATERELAAPAGWRTLTCGVGPVEAAAATAAAVAAEAPALILHVGIAGARRAKALAPGTIVLGTSAVYCDLGVDARWAPATVEATPRLLERAARLLPEAPRLAIGTTARVDGSRGSRAGDGGPVDVEAMEGFAVLRAAQLAGVPALEVRAISNDIEEADRAQWHFDAAFAAITAVTPRLVEEFARA